MPESIQARCPNCRAEFQVPAEVAGKKIRCKNCQTVFPVAAGGAAPAKPVKPAGDTFKLADDAPKPGTAKPVKPKAAPGQPPAPAPAKRPFDEDEDTGPAQYVVNKGDEDLARCPFCAKELDPPDTLICLNCGFDLLDRRRHDSKKVYELTAGDYVMHHLPAVACLMVIGVLLTVDIICLMFMRDWFEGSIFEMEETDPNTGKKKFYLPPGFCTVWIIVPSLFIMYRLGKFAVKRFVFEWKPPDKIKK
jgi:predicted Zn finger-like uncharacterized protein